MLHCLATPPSPPPSPPPAVAGQPGPLLEAEDFALVAAGFRSLLPTGGELEPHLLATLEETLGHPGSLFRAQLVFASARRHGLPAAVACELAVAIEYFHTASLLFDDLPAMDDARERRGFPCAHLRHGEAAAMLGALALINQGYALLWRVLATLPPASSARAAVLVNQCLGLHGILDGQARDLHFQSSARGEAEVLAVARGKTVTLIRLTLLLPALAGGASEAELGLLERLAEAWGHAYQVADDFKDLLLDGSEAGKSVRRDGQLGRPNLPAAIGRGPALRRLERWLLDGRRTVALLGGRPELSRLQEVLEREAGEVKRRLARETSR
jgi:geranylgeranyl diphosphate synthase type II